MNIPRLDFTMTRGWILGKRTGWLVMTIAIWPGGTFTEGHPLAEALLEAIEPGSGRWGTSNGFMPTEAPELHEVADGITVPVYTAGIHREISVLPEEEAAKLWFTALTTMEVTRMRDKVKQALVELFGDEARARRLLSRWMKLIVRLRSEGLITRAERNNNRIGMNN